jgi:hypothetical protein
MKWTLAAAMAAVLAVAGGASARAPGAPANLCLANERVAFTCTAGTKLISLCASGDVLRYRYGKPGRPDITYPAPALATPAREAFRFSSTPYAGGGEARVRFTNGAWEYILYTATMAGAWHADGTRDHRQYDGVLVRRDGVNKSNIRCTRGPEADLYPLGDILTPEDFDYDVDITKPGD